MGIFSRLSNPAPIFCYHGDTGERRLTASEYGRLAIGWAFSVGGLQASIFGVYGGVRDTSDILVKIRQSPKAAELNCAAYYATIYCSYPAIRLEISNKIYNDVISGVVDQLGSGLLRASRGFVVTPEYFEQLRKEIGQYSTVFFDAAGHAPMDMDKMYAGALAACQRLIRVIGKEYSQIPFPPVVKADKKDNVPKTVFNSPNPTIENTRKVEAELLIENTLMKEAIQFFQSCDQKKSLTLIS